VNEDTNFHSSPVKSSISPCAAAKDLAQTFCEQLTAMESKARSQADSEAGTPGLADQSDMELLGKTNATSGVNEA
jgi:hypothetical protein